MAFFLPLPDAKRMLQDYLVGDVFHDIHAWQFTPSSCRLIVNDLNELGMIELAEKSFDDSSDTEFFMALSKAGAGCPLSRMALAERTLAEQRAIVSSADAK